MKFKKLGALLVLIPFMFVACSTVTTVVTPAVAQAAGYSLGYYGWAFTTMAPVSQLAINAACSLTPKAAVDPQGTLDNLLNLFQQDWTAAYNVMTNGTYSVLIKGAAQVAINEINDVVGQINALGSNSSLVSQYAVAIVTGICQGVAAAQGKSASMLKAELQTNLTFTQKVEAWYCSHIYPLFSWL
jgi:hypothetical protein